jgi:hypothetical protein
MALPKHSIRKGGHAGRGIDHGLLIAKAKVMARNAVFVILGALAVAWLLVHSDDRDHSFRRIATTRSDRSRPE